MWTTGATHMIARLTSSTLFANHNFASIVIFDQRPVSTITENPNLLTKMRVLRARSPYALFLKANYNEISAKHPNLKLGDISKKVADVWNNLSEEKKQTYVKQFQDQKANYEEEKKRLSPNDLQIVDADQRAKRIENRLKKSIENLPTKRPRSAYVHFLSSLDRGEATLGEFMKGASQRWSQMTVEDKQKFEDLHQEEKQKYVRDLVAWASSVEKESKPASRRSASSDSTKTKTAPVKKTRGKSATGKRTVKKRTTASSKPAASASKSTQTQSSKATSDKETSTSSDDDESSSSTTTESTDSKK